MRSWKGGKIPQQKLAFCNGDVDAMMTTSIEELNSSFSL